MSCVFVPCGDDLAVTSVTIARHRRGADLLVWPL